MNMPKISVDRVRQIVAEELTRLNEEIDHAGIGNVVKLAGKLLDSMSKFKAGASGKMTSSVVPHLEQLEKILEHMVSTPGAYVDVAPKEPKVVSLKAQPSEKK